MNYPKFILSSILFVCIDYLYLSYSKQHFNKLLHNIQNSKIKLDKIAIILCYMLLLFGINYFIIQKNKSELDAFILGIVIYGIYETTNKAIFTNWTWETVLMDTVWGGILFASTTYLTYLLYNYYLASMK